jgi:hypothetical protein
VAVLLLVFVISLLTFDPEIERIDPWEKNHPVIASSAGPVGVEEARAGCKAEIDFPDTARRIQYACYSDRQTRLDYVKFEAPLQDCLDAANRNLQRNGAFTTRPVASGPSMQRLVGGAARSPMAQLAPPPNGVQNAYVNAPWFDPAIIRDGFEGGDYGPHHKTIWIDADRGVFHYFFTN